MSLLEIRGLTKRYGSVVALRDLDLAIAAGTRTAVVGPSGSGKTTLLRLVAGFERPDAGEILVDGVRLSDAAGGIPAHRRNIGLVMQDGALFPHLTVLRNISFGFDRGTSDVRNRALALMAAVQLDPSMAKRRPHELSGGQQQRVALARALARQPKLMLLDEPFSALDSGLRGQMRKAVADILSAAGITTILVTHDQDEAMHFADQIVILRDGALRQAGDPREVYLAPVDRETAEFLGQAIVLDAVIANGFAICALGRIPVRGASQGSAQIMLRPEQIQLQPAANHRLNGTAVPIARVVAAEFGGPSGNITIAIPGGHGGQPTETVIVHKSYGSDVPAVDSEVTVTVVGSAHVLSPEKAG